MRGTTEPTLVPVSSRTSAKFSVHPRRDTKPELTLRRALHKLGLRYRVDYRPISSLRRRADIVFTRKKVAVFVDGCFWHGCPEHLKWPKSNAAWWRWKIEGNRARDVETTRVLEEEGWIVVRIWEHERESQAVALVRAALGESSNNELVGGGGSRSRSAPYKRGANR